MQAQTGTVRLINSKKISTETESTHRQESNFTAQASIDSLSSYTLKTFRDTHGYFAIK